MAIYQKDAERARGVLEPLGSSVERERVERFSCREHGLGRNGR